MIWNESNCEKLKLPKIPSFIFNNLSISGEKLAFIADNTCFVLNDTILPNGECPSQQVPSVGDDYIIQFEWIDYNCHYYLLICSLHSIFIFDTTTEKMITKIDINCLIINNSNTLNPNGPIFQSTTSTNNKIYCGLSNGEIFIITNSDFKIDLNNKLCHGKSISYMCSNEYYVISGDSCGSVKVWETTTNELLNSFDNTKSDSVTCGFIINNSIVLGFSNGIIRAYHPKCGLFLEYQCHVSAVTSMSCHREQDIFATCGEDCMVNIFTIPRIETRHISVYMSAQCSNKLLCGVSFSKEKLYTISYDSKIMHYWKIPPITTEQ